jgi:hypothetical protein
VTAGDVIAMLRRHYLPEGRPPGGIFAPEIASPCGKRRADLIWLPTTIAGGRGLVGHEVKVSRADVMTELADPAKADPWARYCDRWWLVVSDPAMVDGLDIPDAWGIMSPPSGRRTRSMTVVRPAPKLDPVDRAAGVEKLAAWMLYRHHEVEGRHRAELTCRDGDLARAQQEIDALRASGLRRDSPYAERLARLLSTIEKAARQQHIWHVDDDLIVDAVIDAQRARQMAADLVYSMRSLVRSVQDPLASIRGQLEELSKEAVAIAETAGVQTGRKTA